MAIKSKGGIKTTGTKPAPKASPKPAAKSAPAKDESNAKIIELEAKLQVLESMLLAMEKAMASHEEASQKEHAALRSECKKMCESQSSASGRDEGLRKELKQHFKTASSHKHRTYFPKL